MKYKFFGVARHFKQFSSTWIVMALLLSLVLFTQGGLASGQTQPAAQTYSGQFSIIWGDPKPGTKQSPETLYFLHGTSGQNIPLVIDPQVLVSAGGENTLNGKQVTLTGTSGVSKTTAVTPTIQVQTIKLNQTSTNSIARTAVTGNKPYINVLCKFSDVSYEPQLPAYFGGNALMSDSYQGEGSYWREVSYNQLNITGSAAVTQWYILPHPHDYYIQAGSYANLDSLKNDCTSVANAEVTYPNYQGINLMFNAELDGFSWGGTGNSLNLDGVQKTYGMTWLAPWAYANTPEYFGGPTALSHEMGHSFGLPHSADSQGHAYGNSWDVMSNTWFNCYNMLNPTYGCLGQHPNAYHKDSLGWIGSKKFTYSGGTQNITLERLAQPTNTNYLMAQIPVGGSSTHFYTVELRREVGYDVRLPGEAVIIHEVDTTRSEPAHVIGSNGDEGAMWLAGSVYTIPGTPTSIVINSATATGQNITILPTALLPLITPSNLTVTGATANQISLQWTDTNNVETGYRIEARVGTTGNWQEIGVVGTDVSTFNATGLLNGTPYYFRVRAYGPTVTSNYSAEVTATTLFPAPSNLTLTTKLSNAITLNWTDNSNSETAFVIERSAQTSSNWTQITTVGPDVNQYVDQSGIQENTLYYYRLHAQNGYGVSASSSEVSIATFLKEPSNLTATDFSASQINLAWTDNSNGENGFTIERKDVQTGGDWAVVTNLGSHAGTGSMSYNDSGLSGGNVYFYQVRATGAQNSVPSNEASAMTVASGACNVVSTIDNGSGAAGSLSAAIQANCGSISFSLPSGQTILTVQGQLPALPSGTLLGGSCSTSGPVIKLQANVGLPATIVGLRLSGNNKLYGLSIENFPKQDILNQGTGNKLWCTRATK